MKHIANILAVSIVSIGCVVACYGSYLSHNYHMSTVNPFPQYEEIIELPEVIEEAPVEIEQPVAKSDMQVIAEVVMSESGNQPLVGKVAVAATLLNRIDATGRTAESIALEAYSYPYSGVVTNECYRAVEIAMANRDLFPSDMMYFRTKHYHDFGAPYVQIGDHYFSTKEEH